DRTVRNNEYPQSTPERCDVAPRVPRRFDAEPTYTFARATPHERAAGAFDAYFTARGLIGDPTPPVTGSGGAVNSNVQTPACAQSAASASRSNISPSVSPMSRMHSMWSGKSTCGSSGGQTSTLLVSLAPAAPSRACSHSP